MEVHVRHLAHVQVKGQPCFYLVEDKVPVIYYLTLSIPG